MSTPLPVHKLLESPTSRAIEIGDWAVTVSTNPISNARDCDALHAALGFPLPEMTFGSNFLCLEHRPSKWKYEFTTLNALKCVKNGELGEGDGGVKVGYADAWLKSRTAPSSALPMPKTVPTKPYDWTYTTAYAGHPSVWTPPADDDSTSDASSRPPSPAPPPDSSGPPREWAWTLADAANPSHAIPLAELSRPDPILFYAEVPLFEDELHDNGAAHLLVRVRVMPTCLFVLARFTLRVDGVLFRLRDTRLYSALNSTPPLVVRETSGWEAPYDRVKGTLPRRDDLSPLTDSNYIAKVLTGMPLQSSQKDGAGTAWRGLGTTLEVAVLG
ncbi:TIP41-like family-domain-containing protein [Mycena pura]|uniref:TIP41-like family-domain-containing protein n=1 Tax=Mycena pura TaxID=153505 RepID=A0AAD7E4B2_9AGAR|nr:TIP41-like family-domain-containing protein [Mycena pura]